MDEIKGIDEKDPFILLLHHDFLSSDENDNAAINNGYEILFRVSSKKCVAVLHGHTHKTQELQLKHQCYVLGTDKFLFSKEKRNQNIIRAIRITRTGIKEVYSLQYTDNEYHKDDTTKIATSNGLSYNNDDILKLYKDVLADAEYFNSRSRKESIKNLHINLDLKFSEFESQINEYNSDKDNPYYNTLENAQNWEDDSSPSNLWYNHGYWFMKNQDLSWKDALNYIITELGDENSNINSPKHRTLIVFYDTKNIIESVKNDDKHEYLPGIVSMQFGLDNYDNNKLCLSLTIYMRALELRSFLPTNIAEFYDITKQIKERISSIDFINLNIYSFINQFYEEKEFGCFIKSEIDKMTKEDFVKHIKNNDWNKLSEAIENKLTKRETLRETFGLTMLQAECQNYVNYNPDAEIYNINVLIAAIGKAIDSLNCNKETHGAVNDESSVESLQQVINMLKSMN
jgi:hypothetical protein